MAEAAHDVFIFAGLLARPSICSATLKTQGALAAATCFSGRKSCILPHAHQCSNICFLLFALFIIVCVSSAVYHFMPLLFTQGAVFSLFAAVVLWQQEPAERKRPRSFCSLDVDGGGGSPTMCSSVRKRELQEQWPPTAILRRIRRSLGRRGRPLDLKGRESTEERSRTSAVSDRCDVGRMVAAAAAIQRQCERVRRRRLCVAVRRSGVVVSFAVIAAIALRRHRRLFRIRYVICRRYRRVFVFAIYSSSPSLFACVLLLCRHVLVLLSRRVSFVALF
jgi:hypothetical protein